MARVAHFEIHASDPVQLARFYEGLFGWTVTKYPGPMDYWLVKTAGKTDEPGIDGAIVARRGPAPSGPTPTISFVSTINGETPIAKVIQKAEKLGGSVAVPTMPVPTLGWLCYLKDPDGNLFGYLQFDRKAKA